MEFGHGPHEVLLRHLEDQGVSTAVVEQLSCELQAIATPPQQTRGEVLRLFGHNTGGTFFWVGSVELVGWAMCLVLDIRSQDWSTDVEGTVIGAIITGSLTLVASCLVISMSYLASTSSRLSWSNVIGSWLFFHVFVLIGWFARVALLEDAGLSESVFNIILLVVVALVTMPRRPFVMCARTVLPSGGDCSKQSSVTAIAPTGSPSGASYTLDEIVPSSATYTLTPEDSPSKKEPRPVSQGDELPPPPPHAAARPPKGQPAVLSAKKIIDDQTDPCACAACVEDPQESGANLPLDSNRQSQESSLMFNVYSGEQEHRKGSAGSVQTSADEVIKCSDCFVQTFRSLAGPLETLQENVPYRCPECLGHKARHTAPNVPELADRISGASMHRTESLELLEENRDEFDVEGFLPGTPATAPPMFVDSKNRPMPVSRGSSFDQYLSIHRESNIVRKGGLSFSLPPIDASGENGSRGESRIGSRRGTCHIAPTDLPEDFHNRVIISLETRMIEHNVIDEQSDEDDNSAAPWNTSRAARFSVICVTQAGSREESEDEDEYSEEEGVEVEDYESGEDSDREVMAEDMRALKKGKRNLARAAKSALRKIAARGGPHDSDSEEEEEEENEGVPRPKSPLVGTPPLPDDGELPRAKSRQGEGSDGESDGERVETVGASAKDAPAEKLAKMSRGASDRHSEKATRMSRNASDRPMEKEESGKHKKVRKKKDKKKKILKGSLLDPDTVREAMVTNLLSKPDFVTAPIDFPRKEELHKLFELPPPTATPDFESLNVSMISRRKSDGGRTGSKGLGIVRGEDADADADGSPETGGSLLPPVQPDAGKHRKRVSTMDMPEVIHLQEDPFKLSTLTEDDEDMRGSVTGLPQGGGGVVRPSSPHEDAGADKGITTGGIVTKALCSAPGATLQDLVSKDDTFSMMSLQDLIKHVMNEGLAQKDEETEKEVTESIIRRDSLMELGIDLNSAFVQEMLTALNGGKAPKKCNCRPGAPHACMTPAASAFVSLAATVASTVAHTVAASRRGSTGRGLDDESSSDGSESSESGLGFEASTSEIFDSSAGNPQTLPSQKPSSGRNNGHRASVWWEDTKGRAERGSNVAESGNLQDLVPNPMKVKKSVSMNADADEEEKKVEALKFAALTNAVAEGQDEDELSISVEGKGRLSVMNFALKQTSHAELGEEDDDSDLNCKAYTTVPAEKLAAMLLEESALVIDVRGRDFKGGHIPGCKNMRTTNVTENPGNVLDLCKDAKNVKNIVFTCMYSKLRAPKCATSVSKALNKIKKSRAPLQVGHLCIGILEGGMHGWVNYWHKQMTADIGQHISEFDTHIWQDGSGAARAEGQLVTYGLVHSMDAVWSPGGQKELALALEDALSELLSDKLSRTSSVHNDPDMQDVLAVPSLDPHLLSKKLKRRSLDNDKEKNGLSMASSLAMMMNAPNVPVMVGMEAHTTAGGKKRRGSTSMSRTASDDFASSKMGRIPSGEATLNMFKTLSGGMGRTSSSEGYRRVSSNGKKRTSTESSWMSARTSDRTSARTSTGDTDGTQKLQRASVNSDGFDFGEEGVVVETKARRMHSVESDGMRRRSSGKKRKHRRQNSGNSSDAERAFTKTLSAREFEQSLRAGSLMGTMRRVASIAEEEVVKPEILPGFLQADVIYTC